MAIIYTKEKPVLLSKLYNELASYNLTLDHFPGLLDSLNVDLSTVESLINQIIENLPFIKELVDDLIWDKFPAREIEGGSNIRCISKRSLSMETEVDINLIKRFREHLQLIDLSELMSYIVYDNKSMRTNDKLDYKLNNCFGKDLTFLLATHERTRRHQIKINELKLNEDITKVWNEFSSEIKDTISEQFLVDLSVQTKDTLPQFIQSIIASDDMDKYNNFTIEQINGYCGKHLIDTLIQYKPKKILMHCNDKFYNLCSNEQFIPFISSISYHYLMRFDDFAYFSQEFSDLDLIYRTKEIGLNGKIEIFTMWIRKLHKVKKNLQEEFETNMRYISSVIGIDIPTAPPDVVIGLTYTDLKTYLAFTFEIGEEKSFINIIMDYTLSNEYIYVDPKCVGLIDWFDGKGDYDIYTELEKIDRLIPKGIQSKNI